MKAEDNILFTFDTLYVAVGHRIIKQVSPVKSITKSRILSADTLEKAIPEAFELLGEELSHIERVQSFLRREKVWTPNAV